MNRLTLGVVVFVSMVVFAQARPATGDKFYVYEDAASRQNHYCPAGWMGDYGDLKMNQRWDKNPASGKYSIQIAYSAQRKQGAGWAGIYWTDPCNNWGDKKGGWDLSGYKKLKFKARGEKGKEYIDKFQVGGITGQSEPGDSDSNDTGGIELTKQWKEYEIPLDKMDLTGIVGGFCFVVNSDSNAEGAVIYLDDIRYER